MGGASCLDDFACDRGVRAERCSLTTADAVDGLAARRGSVVAMVPSTGEIRAMVSIPEYDPNLIPSQIGRLERDPNNPLLPSAPPNIDTNAV